jgi:hypothetical protein
VKRYPQPITQATPKFTIVKVETRWDNIQPVSRLEDRARARAREDGAEERSLVKLDSSSWVSFLFKESFQVSRGMSVSSRYNQSG